jgi:hypothetical protein
MSSSKTILRVFVSITSLFFVVTSARGDAIYDFENITAGTATPFTDTVNGLSATFTGSASVCGSLGLFSSLTGNVLIQSLCGPSTESGPITIAFSSNLTRITFDFATSAGAFPITFSAFEDSNLVGSTSFPSSLPPGSFNGEGVGTFSGTFNRVVINNPTSLLALDNINAASTAVPEPAALALLGAGLLILTVPTRRKRP